MELNFNNSLINYNLDVESIREEFTNNRVVVIDNFLLPEVAEKIH